MEVNGQLHAPAALHPKERDPGTHWIGGCVGPRAVLDAVVKRKIPSPRQESNPKTRKYTVPREWFELTIPVFERSNIVGTVIVQLLFASKQELVKNVFLAAGNTCHICKQRCTERRRRFKNIRGNKFYFRSLASWCYTLRWKAKVSLHHASRA
jgi:hypothetical protein